ncbi:MAG: glycine cleavage system protein GcvH [Candidatus Tectomicrobia bacterium]|nr:glycine cleavage system protein GcvH [Candidatus Tectomicrobia bacterium]
MEFPADLKYSAEHEWARVQNGEATVGITDFAQDELGDVVYVELPAVGSEVAAEATFGVVESVKAVSDLYAPVSGTVVRINEALQEKPELVNTSPYGEGWMIVVRMSRPEELEQLLSVEEYREQIGAKEG